MGRCHQQRFASQRTRRGTSKPRHTRNPAQRHLHVEALEERRMLSITVDTLVDELDGSIVDGDISLRDAIAVANSGETINFNTTLNGGTISLLLGQMTIADTLTIDANSLASGLTIDAGGSSRIFSIDDGNAALVDVEIRGLTLTGGVGTGSGKGGAIFSVENLTVADSIITSNSATLRGGGIFATGPVTITDSEISDNSADLGGGVFVNNTATISGSTISDNWASTDGGGIRTNMGTTTITDSTFSGNTADNDGGGIWTYQETSITDSTITNNSAENNGGGIWNKSPTSISGSTILLNTAGRGGGIHAFGRLTIDDTEVVGNTANGDIFEGGGGGGGIYATAPMTVNDSDFGGNTAHTDSGGAMWLGGSGTTITNSTFAANTALRGGAIFSWLSDLNVNDSAFWENNAYSDGGGIWTARSSMFNNTEIGGNTAGRNGGGLWSKPGGNQGKSELFNMIISSNWAGGDGGGIWYADFMHITSSTISNNLADNSGGGVFGIEPLTVTHSTISKNRADADNDLSGVGGGIAGPLFGSTLDHTIVAGNLLGIATRDDISTSIAATYSLIGDDTGATITDNGGNLIGTGVAPIDARLAPLANNGGTTETHGLLFGSPALDAGDPGFTAPPDYDQRGIGFDRVVDIGAGALIDMGAYEAQAAPLEADLNLDGSIDGVDFGILAANFGTNGLGYAQGNLNGDNFIDAADIGIMFGAWTGDTGPAAAATKVAPKSPTNRITATDFLPPNKAVATEQASKDLVLEEYYRDSMRINEAEQHSSRKKSPLSVHATNDSMERIAPHDQDNTDPSVTDQALTRLVDNKIHTI